MPLEPTAVRCVRFLRSKTAGFCSSAIGINFCSAPLCSVGLGSNWPLEPARPRWGALPDRAQRKRTEPDRSSLLGDGKLGRITDACCTQHRDEHSPCMECTGATSIYVYLYRWPCLLRIRQQISLGGSPEPQSARKVPLEPAPEPQKARKVFPRAEKIREVLLEPPPEPQNARKAPLEPGPEPQTARKVSLEPTPEPQ